MDLFNNKVLTVSKHSKYALCSMFESLVPANIEVATVIPQKLIVNTKRKNAATTILKDLQIQKAKYFLLISSNRHEKNIVRVLKALTDYRVLLKDGFKFLCLGMDSKIERKLRRDFPKALPCIVFQEYVLREELEALYKNAYAFVYPTISEGFGYPPVEAMKYGTPVIASASTAVTEVCQNAAIYFNPFIPFEIANRLNQLLHEPLLYNDYKTRGLDRFQQIVKEREEGKLKIYSYLFE